MHVYAPRSVNASSPALFLSIPFLRCYSTRGTQTSARFGGASISAGGRTRIGDIKIVLLEVRIPQLCACRWYFDRLSIPSCPNPALRSFRKQHYNGRNVRCPALHNVGIVD